MAAAAAAGMDKDMFADLKAQVKDTSFSATKLEVVALAATTNAFTVEQVIALMEEMSFSADKVKMAETLKDHISDPNNKGKLLDKFSGSDKTKLEGEYKAIKAKAAVPLLPALILPNAAVRDQKEFNALKDKMSKPNMSSDKVKVLEEEVKKSREGFDAPQTVALLKLLPFSNDMVSAIKLLDSHILGLTCADVNSILSVFSFSNDKLTVLPLLKSTILDGQLKHVILNAFTMSGDKQKAAEILKDVKAAVPPRSPLFGTVRATDVVFVLDVSGSMDTKFVTSQKETVTRLTLSIRELKNVINEHLPEGAKFEIVTFGSAAKKLLTSTANAANRAAACKALDGVKTSGSTNASAALKLAFEAKSADAIYFLSDGEPDQPAANILKEVEGYLKARHIPINGIAFLLPGKVPKARDFIHKLTEASGGVFRAFE